MASKAKLDIIKDSIYSHPGIKSLCRKTKLTDRHYTETMECIKDLLGVIKGVISVDTMDQEEWDFKNGFRRVSGKFKDYERVITIKTEQGTLQGTITAFGCGTVEAPLACYDTVLQVVKA